LNGDGTLDLVPEFDQYVFYRFDLDKLIEQAGIQVDDTLYINFHRLAFYNTDVTLFDNIRVYRESETVIPPSVIGVELTQFGNPDLNVVAGAKITFDRAVNGFTLSDLSLTRDGGPNLLDDSVGFVPIAQDTYQIVELLGVVDLPGEYRLTLNAANSGIISEAGEMLAEGFSRTWTDTRQPGDANLDGVFNSGDLVQVFTFGEYEDADVGNSHWESGDWNGDGDFNTSDLVVAFITGKYSDNNAVARAAISAGEGNRPTLDKSDVVNFGRDQFRIDERFARPQPLELIARDAVFERLSDEGNRKVFIP
jgi:hypothetical protein